MEELAVLKIESFASKGAWEQWLDMYHERSQGIWIIIAKKNSAGTNVSYSEALEVALCFGWINGQKKPYDQDMWLQKFTRRRSKSVWSKVNLDKVTHLIASGKMKPSGCRATDGTDQR